MKNLFKLSLMTLILASTGVAQAHKETTCEGLMQQLEAVRMELEKIEAQPATINFEDESNQYVWDYNHSNCEVVLASNPARNNANLSLIRHCQIIQNALAEEAKAEKANRVKSQMRLVTDINNRASSCLMYQEEQTQGDSAVER